MGRAVVAVGAVLDPSEGARERVCIELDELGRIVGLDSSCPPTRYEDLRSYVGVPLLCDAHTHVLDAGIPEAGEGEPLHALVSQPRGLKYKLLEAIGVREAAKRASLTVRLLADSGVEAMGAYGEMGAAGAEAVKDVLSRWRIRGRIFAQPAEKGVLADYVRLGKEYGGVGFDTLFDLDPDGLEDAGRAALRYGFLIQAHVSEDKRLAESKDYDLLYLLPPRYTIAVHLTHTPQNVVASLAADGYGLVLCPRSNTMLAAAVAPVTAMLRLWLRGELDRAGLGTDNIAWVGGDTLQEAQHAYMLVAWRTGHAEELARMLLYMATGGCRRVLGFEEPAGLLLLEVPELQWSDKPFATVVKRGASRRRVLIGRGEEGKSPHRFLGSRAKEGNREEG